jgi:hypothetical protein
MAAAGDAAKVVLIDRDYKAKETPATRELEIFLGARWTALNRKRLR